MEICHDELKDALVSFRIFLKFIVLIENVLMFDFLFENLYIYIYYQKPLFIIKMKASMI